MSKFRKSDPQLPLSDEDLWALRREFVKGLKSNENNNTPKNKNNETNNKR